MYKHLLKDFCFKYGRKGSSNMAGVGLCKCVQILVSFVQNLHQFGGTVPQPATDVNSAQT